MSFNGRLPNDSRIDVPFTSFEMDVAVAIYAVGGMFGALPAGYLADLIGRWGQDQSGSFRPEVVLISAHLLYLFDLYRKYAILLNNVVIWVGVALESFAIHPIMFIVGRFVVGLNSGGWACCMTINCHAYRFFYLLPSLSLSPPSLSLLPSLSPSSIPPSF